MSQEPGIRRIAFLGNYVPRKCGIATFTTDLHTSIARAFPSTDCFVIPVNDIPEGYDYPPPVHFELTEADVESYHRAADFLNLRNVDIACLQHEYGIFGGAAGSHILKLMRALRMPVVSTLHTVLQDPSPEQRAVLCEIVALSARVIVMTKRSRTLLMDRYGIPASKIELIPHGIPDMPFVDPSFFKDKLGVPEKIVGLTFGLISPNKGIEHMLRAMPEILRACPSFVYIVLGATHPNLVREQGERYRTSLERLVRDLNITNHVIFANRFVELEELTEYIVASDVYVTPYLNPAQIVSGTLAYSFGCGKAVVSTPYWHAEELLAEGRGVIVPFADSKAIAKAVTGLLNDPSRCNAMRRAAYQLGREMIWPRVAERYMNVFDVAWRARYAAPAVRTTQPADSALPPWRLDHLRALTDATGIFQFADYGIPTFAEGYCTDDNARALLLTALLDELCLDEATITPLATTYAAFLQFAFDRDQRRFRNFLSFDRRWQEQVGSDDCHGRSVWAMGECVGRGRGEGLIHWAAEYFEQAAPAIEDLKSPRAWALGLLGIQGYLRRLEGDRRIGNLRKSLAAKLLDRYKSTATEDWPWFEDTLSYDNARLPQALISSGERETVVSRAEEPSTLASSGCKSRHRVTSGPSVRTAFILEAASPPGSISSRSRPRRRSPPACRRFAPPATPSGSRRHVRPLRGSSAPTTSACQSTTSAPAAAATV